MKRINLVNNITGVKRSGEYYLEQDQDGIFHFYQKVGKDTNIEIEPRNFINYNVEEYKDDQ